MGSSSSAKPRGQPRKLLRAGGAAVGEAPGGSAAGARASRPPRRKSLALRLDRVDRSVADRVREGDHLGLVDDGRKIAAQWQRQTLGFIRRSDVIGVRNAGSNAATVSKIVRPTKIWILLA